MIFKFLKDVLGKKLRFNEKNIKKEINSIRIILMENIKIQFNGYIWGIKT